MSAPDGPKVLTPDPIPVTLHTVREIARALPGVEEGTAYGTVAFRVRKHFLCRLHESGEALVMRVPLAERAALTEAEPVTFFVNAHLAALRTRSCASKRRALPRWRACSNGRGRLRRPPCCGECADG